MFASDHQPVTKAWHAHHSFIIRFARFRKIAPQQGTHRASLSVSPTATDMRLASLHRFVAIIVAIIDAARAQETSNSFRCALH
jgi:hypothetical protein